MSERTTGRQLVFLCHNGSDRDLAVPLAGALERHDVQVFCSSAPEAIPPTSTWGKAVDAGLKSSSAFVVLLTSSGLTHWMEQECHYAVDKMGRDGTYKVLPLLAPGAEPRKLPALISTLMGIRLTLADARDLSSAAQKVAAAIGLSPSDDDSGHPGFRPFDTAEIVRASEGGYEMVEIPGGAFEMGSPDDEEGHDEREGPVHRVEVEPFCLGRCVVTNEEFERFLVASPGVRKPEYWSDKRYSQPQQPVIGVSWFEARAYCEWAGLRLPSEAEWEYACRGGTSTRYWSGDGEEDLARVGWYGEVSGARLHPVGELPPNPFGLHDMHGNVLEWCEDKWHLTYRGAPGDGSTWTERGLPARTLRGGGWDASATSCRCASRRWFQPMSSSARNAGFRAALSRP